MFKREFGILLPISSLPSNYGIGTLGKEAYEFIDLISRLGVKVWQILPIGPTGYGNSPYQSVSAFAGNENFIDLEILQQDGLLYKNECDYFNFGLNPRRINYGKLFENRLSVLKKAFLRAPKNLEGYDEFCNDEEMSDYAIFCTLKEHYSYKPWYCWEPKYRDRDKDTLNKFCDINKKQIEFHKFLQYIFFNQYKNLKEYAAKKGIKIFGDIPYYVALDSVDVWKNRDIFLLNEDGTPKAVAGVPPDAFSEDGQLWGNPVYNWEELKKNNYSWWNERIKRAFELFDILRIDHFRGFDRFYAISSGDAKIGEWLDGPKFDFFKDKLNLNIVAEDLGIIDDGVRKLLDETGYPGMKVLSFAFNGDQSNPYLPSNFEENSVVYTGTHDNLPIRAYIESLDKKQRDILMMLLRQEFRNQSEHMRLISSKVITDKIVELAISSKAKLAVIPLCDLLRMGKEATLNYPSTNSEYNWSFRYLKTDFDYDFKIKTKKWIEKYKR